MVEREYQLHKNEKSEGKSRKIRLTLWIYNLCNYVANQQFYSSITNIVKHNFIIFNIKTKEIYCCICNEIEGCEISSILSGFINNESKDIGQDEEIIFYSDR